MSRCFPFPPPGYEKKITAGESDSLKKEKQKEKHKKEKKDKDKKESKQKCEKDRTDQKHRDKKDKKEKHKDKKKDKDRDRDKVKQKGDGLLPDDRRTLALPQVHVHKLSDNSKERGNDRSATSSENRVAALSAFNNREPVSKNNHVASETKSKNASEMGTKSTVEDRRTVHQLPYKIVPAERKKDEGAVKIAGAVPVLDGKGKTKGKPAFDGSMDVLGDAGGARLNENTIGQNSVGVVRWPRNNAGPSVDGRERNEKPGQISPGLVKLPENSAGSLVDGREWKEKPAIDARMDGQAVSIEASSSGSALLPNSLIMVEAKGKVREEGDDRRGDKRKENDGVKAIRKDKDRDKETKKEEKVKVTEHVQMTRSIDGSENYILPTIDEDGNTKEFSDIQGTGIQNISTNNNQGGAKHSNSFRKRKGIGLNGTYDEFTYGPNKLAKTAASTYPLSENGKSLELCHNAAAVAPGTQRLPMNIKVERTFAPDDTQRPPVNIKVDGKQHKINGVKDEHFAQSSRTIAKAERISDFPAKPHPDTKYLSQVLSVPKMDEWVEFDDQGWLFNINSSQTKAEVEPSGIDETPQVWSKGLWLEPVNVFAFPYVVPH